MPAATPRARAGYSADVAIGMCHLCESYLESTLVPLASPGGTGLPLARVRSRSPAAALPAVLPLAHITTDGQAGKKPGITGRVVTELTLTAPSS